MANFVRNRQQANPAWGEMQALLSQDLGCAEAVATDIATASRTSPDAQAPRLLRAASLFNKSKRDQRGESTSERQQLTD